MRVLSSPMKITWQPVQVGLGSFEEEGLIVLVDGRLVAILVHLTGPYDSLELRNKWFVEAGFGPLSEKHELFSTLDEAEAWVRQHCEAKGIRGSGRTLQS
jgi:hypothetical protein